jgi:hypothetical protein
MSSIYFGFIGGHPWMIKSRIAIIQRKDLRGKKKKRNRHERVSEERTAPT